MSPLTQGRELKYGRGASRKPPAVSPLTQGRELKLKAKYPPAVVPASPLTRGRELKYIQAAVSAVEKTVAPHAGA